MAIDPLRLRKTLAFLLRHRPDVGRLEADAEGWYECGQVARAASRLMRTRVEPGLLERLASSDPRQGFELERGRIRARTEQRGRSRRQHMIPDILYLPSTRERADEARGQRRFPCPSGRGLRLFDSERRAWLAAHRRSGGEPLVLYVDAGRARRAGVSFQVQGNGQYVVREIATRFMLNLRENFGLQASAGGFLVRRSSQGRLEVGLVRVRRRSGVTWEVAKGKMELGETPAQTAIRELQEEMGIDAPLGVLENLGVSHYGFTTPAGEPRLKVLHLFILCPRGPLDKEFQPATLEGIEQVAFFDPDAAVRVVTHGSLHEPVRRLQRWMKEREDWEDPLADPPLRGHRSTADGAPVPPGCEADPPPGGEE